MANGQNGLTIERLLFDGLSKLGFGIATDNTVLDKDFKVDRVILSPPRIEGQIFYSAPVMVQVTLRKKDWVKRVEFYDNAQNVGPNINMAYVEIEPDRITPEIISPVAAAIANLFYCKNAPRESLVVVGPNQYRATDLKVEISRYYDWMNKKIDGDIHGHITRWEREGFWGFIDATVLGVDGELDKTTFYFHGAENVRDPLLGRLLRESKKLDDVLGTAVVFNDFHEEADKRRRAKNLALAKK